MIAKSVAKIIDLEDMHLELTLSIPEENHVAIQRILTGTRGNVGERPPNKSSIRTNGMTTYHFKDGLIGGHTRIFDRRTVRRQLGFA